MRTNQAMSLAGSILASAAALGGCSWTQFDDLKDDTWVGSIEKPGIDSSSYGIAIQRGTLAGDGGKLVVVGAGQPTRSDLVFNTRGEASLAPSSVELNSQYGINTIEAQPVLIADPTGDDVSLIVNSGASQITVLTGSGQINLHQVFVTPSTVDGGTYMQPPPRLDTSAVQPVQPLIASGDLVVGTFLAGPPNPQPKCKLVDDGTAISPRALGAVSNADRGYDDVLAWGSNGTLYRYDGAVFNGCEEQGPEAKLATGFMPGKGAQILTIDDDHVLLQGHHDGDEVSFLQVYDARTLAAVGTAVTLPKLRTAAVLEVAGTKYAIAGYPTASVGGANAGQVLVYKISTGGLETTPSVTLNDAQPKGNQQFGRAVVAMPFNGKQVIAVAADNEIFVYFRVERSDGTSLYEETRQGR